MIKTNKKASYEMYVVSVIVAVLSFFIYLSFFTGLQTSIATTTDDLSCRALIAFKDSIPGKAGGFFWEIEQKCKLNDPVNLNFKEKEKSYDDLLNGMSRCWYRYGEGKFDFLSNLDTEGSWCFLCGEVNFEDKMQTVNYNDFIDYAKTKKYNESMNYAEFINLKYVKDENGESSQIRDEFYNLVDESKDDPTIKKLLVVLGEQISQTDDLKNKQINGADGKMFIVYRYDRTSMTFEQKMDVAKTGVVVGTVGSIAASALAEGLTEMMVFGAGGSLLGPVGTLGGGVIGFTKGIVKTVFKTTKSVDRVFRISKLMKKVAALVKNTKVLRNIEKIDDVEEVYSILSKGEKSHILNILDKVEDTDKFKDSINNVVRIMDKYDLDDLDNLPQKIIDNKKILAEIKKKPGFLKDAIDKVKENKLPMKIEDLEKLDLEVDEILKTFKDTGKINVGDEVKITDYLRTVIVLGSGAVGGEIGSEYNKNYNQYVDLLTREQYYRLCGTQRFE